MTLQIKRVGEILEVQREGFNSTMRALEGKQTDKQTER